VIDDNGAGFLRVVVPDRTSPIRSLNNAINLGAPGGALNAIFRHEGKTGAAALHILDEPYQMGSAVSQIYTKADGMWGPLLAGGGVGPCAGDVSPGDLCVSAPSFNLRYPGGSRIDLQLIGPGAP
jgi:hypothetical protein